MRTFDLEKDRHIARRLGGTQAATVSLLLARRGSALLWGAVAGFIHALMYAQMIYLVTGLVQLILVFALLGIVSWLPRLDHPATTSAAPSARVASTRSDED